MLINTSLVHPNIPTEGTCPPAHGSSERMAGEKGPHTSNLTLQLGKRKGDCKREFILIRRVEWGNKRNIYPIVNEYIM